MCSCDVVLQRCCIVWVVGLLRVFCRVGVLLCCVVVWLCVVALLRCCVALLYARAVVLLCC